MGTGRLAGRVAIVTGAGSGIGQAAAIRFGREGARVLCADLDGSTAEATATTIAGDGGIAEPMPVDATRRAAVEAMAARAVERWGTIDVLFANAGTSGVATALSCDDSLWDHNLNVSLRSAWLSSQAVLPTMIGQHRGSIILMSTAAAVTGLPKTFPHAAAKGAIIAITRQMAADFGPDNIRVNALAPGAILTPLLRSTYEERARQGAYPSAQAGMDATARTYKLGRLGTVDDCANLAVFLASDESSWFTGSIFTVDGGLTTTSALGASGTTTQS